MKVSSPPLKPADTPVPEETGFDEERKVLEREEHSAAHEVQMMAGETKSPQLNGHKTPDMDIKKDTHIYVGDHPEVGRVPVGWGEPSPAHRAGTPTLFSGPDFLADLNFRGSGSLLCANPLGEPKHQWVRNLAPFTGVPSSAVPERTPGEEENSLAGKPKLRIHQNPESMVPGTLGGWEVKKPTLPFGDAKPCEEPMKIDKPIKLMKREAPLSAQVPKKETATAEQETAEAPPMIGLNGKVDSEEVSEPEPPAPVYVPLKFEDILAQAGITEIPVAPSIPKVLEFKKARVGYTYHGVVRSLSKFGAFVQFGPDRAVFSKEGLIPGRSSLRVSAEVKVRVEYIDYKRQRLTLSLVE